MLGMLALMAMTLAGADEGSCAKHVDEAAVQRMIAAAEVELYVAEVYAEAESDFDAASRRGRAGRIHPGPRGGSGRRGRCARRRRARRRPQSVDPPFAYAAPGLCHSRTFMTDTAQAQDLGPFARDPGPLPGRRASAMASALVGSEILRIAAEIRALAAAGHRICDLTVGDFDPRQFPIPELLREAIGGALARGETNYPPSNGIASLREAVVAWYSRDLGLDYPVESVVIASGSRPVIYALYRTVCDPGRPRRLPGAELEQQPLRPPGGRDRRARRLRARGPVPSAARRDRAGAAGGAPPLPELAPQPDRHRLHRRHPARHRGRGGGGERDAANRPASGRCT